MKLRLAALAVGALLAVSCTANIAGTAEPSSAAPTNTTNSATVMITLTVTCSDGSDVQKVWVQTGDTPNKLASLKSTGPGPSTAIFTTTVATPDTLYGIIVYCGAGDTMRYQSLSSRKLSGDNTFVCSPANDDSDGVARCTAQ